MYLRRNNKIRSEVSFDEPLNIDWDGNELLLSDVLGTDDDIITRDIEANVDKKLLKKALEQLNDREKQIMELRFGLIGGEEKTQKDVADMLGISQSYISRLEKELLNDYKKNLIKWSKNFFKKALSLHCQRKQPFFMILVIARAYFSIPRRY